MHLSANHAFYFKHCKSFWKSRCRGLTWSDFSSGIERVQQACLTCISPGFDLQRFVGSPEHCQDWTLSSKPWWYLQVWHKNKINATSCCFGRVDCREEKVGNEWQKQETRSRSFCSWTFCRTWMQVAQNRMVLGSQKGMDFRYILKTESNSNFPCRKVWLIRS